MRRLLDSRRALCFSMREPVGVPLAKLGLLLAFGLAAIVASVAFQARPRAEQAHDPKAKIKKQEYERARANVPAKSSQEKSGRGPKNPVGTPQPNPKVVPNLGVRNPVVIPPPNVTIDPISGATNPQPQPTTVDSGLEADPNHRVPFSCAEKLKACQADNSQLKAENASLNSELRTLQGQIQQLQTQVQNLSKVPTCNGQFWNHPVYGTIDCSPYACRRDQQGCYSSCTTVSDCAHGDFPYAYVCDQAGHCVPPPPDDGSVTILCTGSGC
jgi:hypothetical protein